ncbi:MAG: excinuclease ABC subunit UvrC [Alphaproteobacteria bacterium]
MVEVIDGIDYLKTQLALLPSCAGVYRMLNGKGELLYVGKAKHIKKRVTQYTQPERMAARIRKMVFETRELIVVHTASEAEALLLEANLIKSLKPKYNILFRDDASYVSVLITKDDTPRISAYRGTSKVKGTLYGPYPSATAVYETLDVMERVFQLRTCKDSEFAHRTRPCLKFDIKRCSGPCVGKIAPEAYAARVKQAQRFLTGQEDIVRGDIQADMAKASSAMDYETAAMHRDRLQALTAVTTNRTALTHALPHGDVFAVAQVGGQACIQAFFYRNSRHVGNRAWYPTVEENMETGELLTQFMIQYYTRQTVPPVVLCSTEPVGLDALTEALETHSGHKVDIAVPQRGDKAEIVRQALHNATESLQRKVAESGGWQTQMAAFGTMLGLNKTPERIECFDISNISGKQAVASLVVAGAEGMDKRAYRKFTIKEKDTPDDYAMMRETLTRRYAKLVKEDAAQTETIFPDIILVDGGVGHLNVLVEVAQTVGLLTHPRCPALCSIAKGEFRDKGLESIFLHTPAGIQQLPIPLHSPMIFVLQRIRDEAHRFAIGFHRQKRSKDLTQSGLDAIPNIGGKRKKALLLHFGSLQGVKQASVDDLAKVPGINHELAEQIFGWFGQA